MGGFNMVQISEIDGKTPEQMEKILEFAKNPKGFFLMAGSNGTGKSFVAEAIYNSIRVPIHEMDLKLMISQTDLNLKWQKQLKDWGETTYLLDQIISTKILVLDDIGTRTPTESFMDFLYAIADKRYSDKFNCGTIITTNLNSQNMRLKFGDAFVSRVASGVCLRMDGKDRRFLEF